MDTGKFVELLMQMPFAGVNVVVVVLFLRYLDKYDERQRAFMAETRKENNLSIDNLAIEVDAMRELTIEHNTLMLAAIQELRTAVAGRRRSDDRVEKTRTSK